MIEIRACSGFDELEACVQLQIETWGYDESDVIPRKTFLVAQKIGGQVIGAFDSNLAHDVAKSLVGFAFSLPGIKTDPGLVKRPGLKPGASADGCVPRAYLHSHMLAVREDYRNRGLGSSLKLEQRREALSRGIRHMEWTFDPLEIKNAFLNIHKLGAIVCGYQVNFYGVSSSRLQGGLPTDRLVAEWELDSPRVQTILDGHPANEHAIEERILVPASIYEWKASGTGRERALAVQLENRKKFQQAFSRGLAILGFFRDAEGNGVFELGPLPRQSWTEFPRNAKTL
jgi:predicted GNAT superfamily acetyltransferase